MVGWRNAIYQRGWKVAMEHLSIKINQPHVFDSIIHGSDGITTLQDGGDMLLVTKHDATDKGAAIACISFSVDVGGKMVRAQTVTTVKLLLSTLKVMTAHYTEDGKPKDV